MIVKKVKNGIVIRVEGLLTKEEYDLFMKTSFVIGFNHKEFYLYPKLFLSIAKELYEKEIYLDIIARMRKLNVSEIKIIK